MATGSRFLVLGWSSNCHILGYMHLTIISLKIHLCDSTSICSRKYMYMVSKQASTKIVKFITLGYGVLLGVWLLWPHNENAILFFFLNHSFILFSSILPSQNLLGGINKPHNIDVNPQCMRSKVPCMENSVYLWRLGG